MSPPRRAFFSPELAFAVTPASLQLLLDAAGDPTPLPTAPLERARLLWDGLWSARFCDALERLAWFGTSSGREAFVEAAEDRQLPHDGWEDTPPLDLAARLLARPEEHEAILLRAQIRLSRYLPERATYELAGGEPRRLRPSDTLGAALSAVARGPWSELWLHEEDDGTLRALLLCGAPADVAMDLGPDGVTTRSQRVFRADAFQLLPARARLVITTARPSRVHAYGAAWGQALYGDAAFFGRRPSVTLKPLLALPKGIDLTTLPKGITRASVITVQLDMGDGRRREERGPGVLEKLLPVAHAGGGYLARATLRFEIEGEGRPVDAVLELPNRVHIGAAPSSRAARLVRAALEQLGLLSPGAMGDDVTTLHPGAQAAWRYRAVVGDDGFDAMLKAGLLEAVPGERTRRPATEELRHLGRSAVAFPLRPARPVVSAPVEYYASAEDWGLHAVTLGADEMVMYRLAPNKLAAKVRRELGLVRGLSRGERPKLPKGVLWLGELRVPSGVVRFVYVMRAVVGEGPQRAIGKAISRAVGFGRAVAFVAAGRRIGRDFTELELSVPQQLGTATWQPLLEAAARDLGVLDEIPIERLAPPGARILVDVQRTRVFLDGEPLLRLGESGYRLVKFLAEHVEAVVARRGRSSTEPVYAPTADTDAAISGNRHAEGTTRTTVYKMKAWVRESLEDAAKRVPREVAADGLVKHTPKRGWRLVYPAWIKR